MRESMGRVLIATAIFGILIAGCSKGPGNEFVRALRVASLSASLDEASLKTLYSKGVTMDMTWTKAGMGWLPPGPGAMGKFTFRPDGSASLDMGKRNDKGSWRISGDSICTKWEKTDGGWERCFTVHIRRGRFLGFGSTKGAFHFYNSDGSYYAEAKLAP